MFNVMSTRWFYLSEKFLIGRHPVTMLPVLVVRNGEDIPTMEIERVLELNGMELIGPMVSDNNIKYYELKEKDNDTKATSSGVSG